MNFAHIHIVLNHVPSLGCIAGLVMLASAIYTKHEELKKFSFLALVLIGMSALPTYISGAEAQRIVRQLPAVSKAMIQLHQNAAMLTIVAMTITGTFAWFGLWEFRRFSRAGSLTTKGTLLAAAVTVGLILYTGSIGGKISHPEIRNESDAAVSESVGWREPVEVFVSDKAFMWPAGETLHFLGMILLFGISLLLMLRMLGGMKSIPFTGIHRLLPLGILGFVINVLTGMMFFIANPGIYYGKTSFHIKIALIVLATAPLLYFTLFDEPWETHSNENSRITTKVAAICTFGLLFAVVIIGRLLPFLN